MTQKILASCQGTQFANVRRAENGYRIGQDHQRARLSDEQVRAMRALYVRRQSIGKPMGYGALGEKFGCSMWTARDIVRMRTRVSA